MIFSQVAPEFAEHYWWLCAALFWFLVSNWCNIRNKFPCLPLLRRLLLLN